MDISLVAFIGPSAAGKYTVAKHTGLPLFTTLTTRKQRESEVPSVDYNFITVNDFLERRKGGYLIEDTEYAGNYYGTGKRDLDIVLKKGMPHCVIVTYEGYQQIVKHVPENSTISIFIWAPKEQLSARMRERGDDEEVIQRRLELYDEQMATGKYCDYIVPCFDYYQYLAVHRVREILSNHGILLN